MGSVNEHCGVDAEGLMFRIDSLESHVRGVQPQTKLTDCSHCVRGATWNRTLN
jgi:hypothetical protein